MAKSTEHHITEKQSEKITKEGSENEPGMRVGNGFQAVVPEMLKEHEIANDHYLEPLLLWAPTDNVPDEKLHAYLKVAKDKFGYTIEQALGMLFWHKYDAEKATEDLKNFTPLPDEWSMEDKVIFDQSFHSYGKSFSRIKQQLPDKSVGSLVKYYYTWKKNRNKKSLMDKSEKPFNGLFADDSDNQSSDSDYEPSEKKLKPKRSEEKSSGAGGSNEEIKASRMLSTNCVNCAGVTSQMNLTPRGKMCVPCYHYWRRTGNLRPKDTEGENFALYHGPQHKLKRKPPKGMQLKQEVLIEVAQSHGDSHTRPLDVELIALRRQLLTERQTLHLQQQCIENRAQTCRPPEISQKSNARWTNEELLIAVQCVRRYGQDFDAMSQVLGNKNEGHCRSFFINYQRRFNLLDILREYENENNIAPSIPPQQPKDGGTTTQPPALRRQEGGAGSSTDLIHGPPPLISNGQPV